MAPLKPPSLPPLAKYIAGKRASEAAKAKKAHVRVNAPPPADVEGGPLSETDWAGINRGDGESKATTVKGMWGLERQLDAIPDASAEKLVAVLPDRSLGIEIYASAPVALLYQIVTLITLPLFVLYLLLKAIMGIFLWMANGVVYYCCCGRPSFAEVKVTSVATRAEGVYYCCCARPPCHLTNRHTLSGCRLAPAGMASPTSLRRRRAPLFSRPSLPCSPGMAGASSLAPRTASATRSRVRWPRAATTSSSWRAPPPS